MGFLASRLGKFSGGLSNGVLSVSLGGGSWGTGLSLSQDLTKPIGDAFAWINSKLPAASRPLDAVLEGALVTGLKTVSVTF